MFIKHVPKPPFCVGRLGGSKNDADVVSHSPVQQCRWPSGGPAVPTASVLVGWKCSIVHFVAYNFSTLHLCRRCLLSERRMARCTQALPRAAAVCRGQGRPHGGPREAGGRLIRGRCALIYPHRHRASAEGFTATILSDARCTFDHLHGPCAGHLCMH